MIPIRREYERIGVKAFYETKGSEYVNPHEYLIVRTLEKVIKGWEIDLSNVLDLAAGSGEVSLVVLKHGGHVSAIDPFTFAAYYKRTGQIAERWTFDDVASGVLQGRNYSVVICSYAMHLVEPSRLPLLLYRLGEISNNLLIVTPHKRPEIKNFWQLSKETVFNARKINYHRTRCRMYAKI